MNYFITGATGFIGVRLIERILHTDNIESIRILSRTPHPYIETVVCDLGSDMIPDNVLDGIDTVFHLAGYAHDIEGSQESMSRYYKINVDSTQRLLDLMKFSSVKRFIFVSSVKAGGLPRPGHCKYESDLSEPEGAYGHSKRDAEVRIIEAGIKYGVHVSIVRPSLVYGPGVKGNLKKMISAIDRGWFPPLPKVNNRRSMVHVDDLINALMLVHHDNRACGEIYNVTDGHHYSSREIYNVIRRGLNLDERNFGISILVFRLAAILGDHLGRIFPFNSYSYNKLLGDECYSSEKLQGLGFRPEFTLQSTISEVVEHV